MPNISRRTFVTASASLLATGTSFMALRGADAATVGATAMDGHHMSEEEMQRCIQLCHDCHARCIQVIGHCLKLGGRHATPDHIRLLMDCAQMCTTTADFMARESSFHDRMCSLCSDLCQRCAESCEQVEGNDQLLKQCAELCRRCSGSCERMASKKAA